MKDEKSIFKYMILCGFITYSVIPTLFNILGINYNGNLYFPMTGGYLLFVLLGYILAEEDYSKKIRVCSYVVAFICIFLRFYSTVYMSNRTGELYQVFWGYLNFPSVGLAVGVFLFFRYFDWYKLIRQPFIIRFIEWTAGASFGIYLIHMIIMNLFWRVGVNVYGVKWRLLGAPIIYVISLGIVKVLQKVPIIKKIVP